MNGTSVAKCDHFIDGKHSIDNFTTTELHRFVAISKSAIKGSPVSLINSHLHVVM